MSIVDVIAATALQEGLYALAGMDETADDPYVIGFLADLDGPVDLELLKRSMAAVIDRHPHLRGAFFSTDLPHPVLVVPDRADLDWTVVTTPASDTELEELAEATRRRRFDLHRGPLIRATIAARRGGGYRFICVAHHTIIDGWSLPIFVREMLSAYVSGGSVAGWPPARPYRDHVALLRARDHQTSENVWRSYVEGLDAPTLVAETTPSRVELPTSVDRRLTREQSAQVIAFARSIGVTVNTLTQVAWALILRGLTGADDVVYGATSSGRPDDLPGAADMIGLFITTLPVRIDLADIDDGDVAQVCRRVQRDAVAMRAHDQVGLAQITAMSGHSVLFDTLLVFQNAPRGMIGEAFTAPDGMRVTPIDLTSLTHYPLTVVPYIDDGVLATTVEMRPDMGVWFDAAELAERVLWVTLALSRVASIDDIDLLLPGEPAAITAPDGLPDNTSGDWSLVGQALALVAARHPDRTAVIAGRESITFAGLDSRVEMMAARLRAAGVRAGDAVTLLCPRDISWFVALFAVARVGAVAVFTEVNTPAARLSSMVSRTASVAVVSTEQTVHLAAQIAGDAQVLVDEPDGADTDLREDRLSSTGDEMSADAPLYIVFTSGTTGEPKGVVGTHRGIRELWADHDRRVYRRLVDAGAPQPLTVGHAWSTGFDAAWQPTLALLSGHTVAMFGDEVRHDPLLLVGEIERLGVDMMETSPSMLPSLIDAGLFRRDVSGQEHALLRGLGLGGEAVDSGMWRRIQQLHGTVGFNFYGPTETTVDAVSVVIDDAPVPLIGRPVAGLSAHVLDDRLKPVPRGGVGELYLSGPQVAVGYLDDPAQTAQRFVGVDGGLRAYRTGDVVRRLPDDRLAYHGRSDAQVKIRGFRVEPGELVAALRGLSRVADAAVVVTTNSAGAKQLSAFVVSASTGVDLSAIRRELAEIVPRHLIPASLAAVSAIPMTPNGKVDSAALRAQAQAAPQTSPQRNEAPETDTEKLVHGVVATMLGSEIGVTTDLLDAGLDSITAMRLAAAIRSGDAIRSSGVVVSARMVAGATTIRDLAAMLDSMRDVDVQAESADTYGSQVAGPTPVTPTPVMAQLLDGGRYRRFAQHNLIALPDDVTPQHLATILRGVAQVHPMLRSRVTDGALLAGATPELDVEVALAGPDTALADVVAATVGRLDPATAAMVAATQITATGRGGLLLLAVHHLAVDAVSWQILLEDIATVAAGATPAGEAQSYADWSATRAGETETVDERPDLRPLGSRPTDPTVDTHGDQVIDWISCDQQTTEALLEHHRDVEAMLREAVALMAGSWWSQTPPAQVTISTERHGRNTDPGSGALDRTVGWFTRAHTVAVDLDGTESRGRERPVAGPGQVELNYLGRIDQLAAVVGEGVWVPVLDPDVVRELNVVTEPELALDHEVELVVAVAPGPVLVTGMRVNARTFDESERTRLSRLWAESLHRMAVRSPGALVKVR
ncbi:mycobactin non-ribosomal peptide synthetase MbtF [Gordonia jinhuaensis]|uniref:Non-ribosomal peptide synthetase n=1 Tax=Gordonia jinhuaensis TaxID=1517702 RepID=A0A916TEP9_9ACTN|nr:AMP-binding protein [Gordonia jinhuaensis]GGB42113.1 non-ribosomal peptide synthetase [Gordonia jinhuaensis]